MAGNDRVVASNEARGGTNGILHTDLTGRRLLIVGASSGIGAALARAAVAAGAKVVVSARREAKLQALVEQIGGGIAIAGDAADADSAKQLVARAAERLQGLDLVVYAAGYGVLQPLRDCDPEVWASVYRVNVIGANLIAGAALEHMDRAGVLAFISSRTVEDGNALFASYAASKAALDRCIGIWRSEHPEKRFVRVVMGNCLPTDFVNHMGAELLGEALERWTAQGIPGGAMEVNDAAAALLESLAVSLAHPEIDLSEIKMDARVDVDGAFAEPVLSGSS